MLVDVQASGLCHTDLLFATHDIAPTPSVLGHEVAGIVAEVGPDVTQVHAGDHVVGSLAQSCGGCARCLSGRPFQCQHPESTLRRPDDAPRLSRNGIGVVPGLWAGWLCRAGPHPREAARGRAEGDALRAGCLAGLRRRHGGWLRFEHREREGRRHGRDLWRWRRRAQCGQRRAYGRRFKDRRRSTSRRQRLDAARRFGATDVIDSTKSKPVEAVRDLLPGGADHVFDFVGLKAGGRAGPGHAWRGGWALPGRRRETRRRHQSEHL